uniref:dihydrofolate reductase n=1 Tax=Macrostomum lignano TaxID=282301 RepID=A0A1I8I391_9PLAT
MPEQVNLVPLSADECTSGCKSSNFTLTSAFLESCNSNKLKATYLSAGNIEMQIDINEDRPQIYSAVAESCSMVAKYSFVNSREADSPLQAVPLFVPSLSGRSCLLTRFAALQIMSPECGNGDRLECPIKDIWMQRISDKSHWQEEAPSLLGVNPPQNPLVRLRMWRHIGADKLNELTLAVSVAALDSNGGFANSTQLPWPNLMLDVEYFTRNTRNDHEMDELEPLPVVNISGRVSFETMPINLALDSRRIHLVIGSRMATVAKKISANSFTMLPSLKSALDYAKWLANHRLASPTVWIMGGQEIYRSAVTMATCQRVHLTRVLCDLPADRFFPMDSLDELFKLESVSGEMREHGIPFRFEVYSRKE